MLVFLRPILTFAVFAGVIVFSCWVASFFVTLPSESEGLLQFLMLTGVPGLAVVVMAMGPFLIPVMVLAVILARETWQRLGKL